MLYEVITGPAVNFGLAILLGIVALFFDLRLVNPATILDELQSITFSAVFGYVFFYNIFLGIFNLLPAFRNNFV